MTKTKKRQDPLDDLLSAASPKVLAGLIVRLTSSRPDVRRECLEYLKKHASLSPEQKKRSEGEAVLALWSALVPDLDELDSYGGGDYSVTDHVGELLVQIQEKLSAGRIEGEIRRGLLEEILPFIRTGNAGLDDELYAVAYAACYEAADWRHLAQSFEGMEKEWPADHARRIYRKLGDREKYLELRGKRMVYGADYHDLVTFYWEAGEKEKAIAHAELGLKKGEGRMDELRAFLAERARESGDRKRYLALEFAQATECLTLEKYKAFKKCCSPAEWEIFEPKVLNRLAGGRETETLKIRMHRQEYDAAVAVLIKCGYPTYEWDGSYGIQVAKKLEARFPEEILGYYVSGLGNIGANAVRKEYARKAKVMCRIRSLLLDVLKAETRWREFASIHRRALVTVVRSTLSATAIRLGFMFNSFRCKVFSAIPMQVGTTGESTKATSNGTSILRSSSQQ